MVSRCFILLGFLCMAPLITSAQRLSGITTRWSDAYSEWMIFAEEEEDPGELRQRWAGLNDWTEWEYRIGESTGQIRLKWKQDLNEWEIRGENQIITARTLWNNNFREWRITDNTRQFTLSSRYNNVVGEWEIRDSNAGTFSMYTAYDGDPRDWVIVDELDPSVSLPTKMAMVFMVIFHSIPKD